MSETMTVYFVSQTGNVLGAVTRVAGTVPAAPRAVSLEDVLVRGIKTDDVPPASPLFLVPATELSTLTLSPRPDVLLEPLSFQVVDQTNGVDSFKKPDRPSVKLDITPAATTVTVTAPVTVGADTAVWVLITGDTLITPRIAVGVIKKGSDHTEPPLPLQPLSPGIYHVLALVKGFPPSATIHNP